MKLSVIVPIYNAEKFLARAIESILVQQEVNEILLIEDGSPDNSLQIALEYVKKYPNKIKLYQHQDKKNHGAGETRNLGIKMATGTYIAFLDADDIYLPNRFKNTVEILRNNPDIDGTHAMLGVFFENDKLKKQFAKRYELPTGLIGDTGPSDVIKKLMMPGYGGIHLDTLTFKKSMIEKTGYFDKDLKISQDCHFIGILALCAKLAGEPRDIIVAQRRVHDNNRITNEKNFFKYHKMLVPRFIRRAKEYNIDICQYLPALTLKHFNYLKGYSQVFSNKNIWLLKFLFIKELITMPFYIKKLSLKYALKEYIYFLFKNSFFIFTTYYEFLKYLKKKNFQKRFDKFAGKYKDKKVIIYGTGTVFDVITDNFDISSLNVEYVSDVKFSESSDYKGFKAIPYAKIPGQTPDVVLITLQDARLVKNFFEEEIFPKYGKFEYIFLEEIIGSGIF